MPFPKLEQIHVFELAPGEDPMVARVMARFHLRLAQVAARERGEVPTLGGRIPPAKA
jgi:hypothetical protein